MTTPGMTTPVASVETGSNRCGRIIDQLLPFVVPIVALNPDPANARRHPEKNIEALRSSLAVFGQRKPIVVQRTGMIVRAGNGTLAAAKALGWTEIAAVVVDDDNATAVQFAIADNRTGDLAEWDDGVLATLLDGMDDAARGVLGFDGKDVDLLLKGLLPPTGATQGAAKIENFDEDLPGSMALKTDMAFPSTLPFGIPEILASECADYPDGEIRTWCGPRRSEWDDSISWLLPWRSVSLDGVGDTSKVIPCFYVEDDRFECLWEAPDKWVSKMLNAGFRTVVSPNFSLWHGQPSAVHIWNTYRSRWLARYMQGAGLKVIPDVNWAGEESFEFCFAGIPTGLPVIAIQLQTLKRKSGEEINRSVAGFVEANRRLAPKSWIVYGNAVANDVIRLAGIDNANVVATRTVHMHKDPKMNVIGNGGGGGGGGGGKKGRGGRGGRGGKKKAPKKGRRK